MAEKIHVDISNKEQVTGVSTGTGMVTSTSWNPNFGYDRKQQIEEARLAALEEQRRQQEEQQPLYLRLAALEGEVMRLKAQVKEMTSAKE